MYPQGTHQNGSLLVIRERGNFYQKTHPSVLPMACWGTRVWLCFPAMAHAQYDKCPFTCWSTQTLLQKSQNTVSCLPITSGKHTHLGTLHHHLHKNTLPTRPPSHPSLVSRIHLTTSLQNGHWMMCNEQLYTSTIFFCHVLERELVVCVIRHIPQTKYMTDITTWRCPITARGVALPHPHWLRDAQ